MVFHKEADRFTIDGIELRGSPAPGVVHEKRVRPGGNLLCDRIAEQEFTNRLAIQKNEDLTLLRVVWSVTIHNKCGGHFAAVSWLRCVCWKTLSPADREFRVWGRCARAA